MLSLNILLGEYRYFLELYIKTATSVIQVKTKLTVSQKLNALHAASVM